MQIKFNDGSLLDVLSVNGTTVYSQGANRSALELQLAKGSVALDALDALTSNSANTDKLTMTDGAQQYVHTGYIIRTELALKSVVVQPALDSSTLDVTEDRLCVTLAQLTYAEVQQAALQATVDALVVSSLEV